MVRPMKRNHRDHAGQVLVEFALCLPLLITLMGAVTDIGFLMWKEHCFAAAVRDGAIYATRLSTSAEVWGGTQTAAVQNYVVAISPGTGLDAAQVSVTTTDADAGVNGDGTVTVQIDHEHNFLCPFGAFLEQRSFTITRAWTATFIINRVGTGPDGDDIL